jgi:transcriptional regulator with XRE-family HTH domain
MDPSEWSAFEKGRKRPSFTKLLEICEKVGKTPDELIYGSRFAPIPNTDSRQATMADRIELLARGLTSGLQGADEELVAAFERQIRQLKLPGRGGDKKRKRKSE